MEQQFYGFEDNMFESQQRVQFFSIKNGEGQLRVLPPYAQGQLFHKVDLHWGYTSENGTKKALKCTLYSHKSCPICKEHDRLKGEIELLKNTPQSQMSIQEINEKIMEIEKRAGDIKRKPTYLWNVLTHDGAQKVLQLSWNGHDPLLSKIKFYWEKKRLNVTDPNANYAIWFQRSGQAAKTRYQYEVLEQSLMKLQNLQALVDLSKVYKDSTPSELQSIVDQGYVGVGAEDPNDRNFAAQMPSGIPQQNQQMGNAPAQPATPQQSNQVGTQVNSQQNLNVGPTVPQNASPSNPPVNNIPVTSNHNPGQFTQPTTQLTPENKMVVDEETARMMAILNGGK